MDAIGALGITGFWLFVASGFLLNVTPGPDMALVIARSGQGGVRAGVAAALGVGAGALVHIVAGAIGVSALLMTSSSAFTVMKLAGAAYIVYLGLRMLIGRDQPAAGDGGTGAAPDGLARIFIQGAMTNALNPKVAIFFLAFLPQFIAPDAASPTVAFVVLGLVFDLVGTVWNVAVAFAASWFAGTAAASGAKRWLERTIGVLFVAAGARLAFAERP